MAAKQKQAPNCTYFSGLCIYVHTSIHWRCGSSLPASSSCLLRYVVDDLYTYVMFTQVHTVSSTPKYILQSPLHCGLVAAVSYSILTQEVKTKAIGRSLSAGIMAAFLNVAF